MKKIILFVLILTLAVCTFGCDKKDEPKNRTYDEEEVKAAAETLIEKSSLFNQIYYGAGMPTKADNPKTTGGYVEVDPAFLQENGIASIDDLKAKTQEVYSEGACRSLFQTVLSVIYDGNTVVSYKRYIEDAGTVYVSASAENLLPDTVTYHYDTLCVDRVEGDVIFVTLLATVENSEQKTQQKTISLRLVEESDGFRLDSMTYVKYYVK